MIEVRIDKLCKNPPYIPKLPNITWAVIIHQDNVSLIASLSKQVKRGLGNLMKIKHYFLLSIISIQHLRFLKCFAKSRKKFLFFVCIYCTWGTFMAYVKNIEISNLTVATNLYTQKDPKKSWTSIAHYWYTLASIYASILRKVNDPVIHPNSISDKSVVLR